MATLIFTALGSLLGGPLGGAVGALAGRQLDALLFKPKPREGPRLTELALSASSFGYALPQLYGRVRSGGQIIWATDLVEQKDRQSNGKGRPATITYSYSASFAVALSSRPVQRIGRIWADGRLLRGAAGDLKIGGTMRLHSGHADQLPDPLIAAAESGGTCPAFRGLAYVVFEDLQLGDFGNRIPALSFEVVADEGPLSLQAMLDPVLPDCAAAVPLGGLEGIAVEGSPAELLALLDPLYPLDCDACDVRLTVRPERNPGASIAIGQPALAAGAEDFGAQAGFARRRSVTPEIPVGMLRYYDPDRDFLPGVQRAGGEPQAGQPRVIEVPATLAATTARNLIQATAGRTGWARQAIDWRVTELDPAVSPGSSVTLPGIAGLWRVKTWEWRSSGIELGLQRVSPLPLPSGGTSDPGRAGNDPDLVNGPTRLVALELPWDGHAATPVPQICAAAGSAAAGWRGAALYVDRGDGGLTPAGSTGRSAALIGSAATALKPATPLLFDRSNAIEILLHNPTHVLENATMRQLAEGANRALLGQELLQFAEAQPLGAGRWQLRGLWRGRGGTELAVSAHQTDEPFILLDNALTVLDSALIGDPASTTIAAIGLVDPAPVVSPILLAGCGWRPLAPVHAILAFLPDGSARLTWVRRSRGGWRWDDGADLPLNEQAESYSVTFESANEIVARWTCSSPLLELSAAEWSGLSASGGSRFAIRQIGDRALSVPLVLPAN